MANTVAGMLVTLGLNAVEYFQGLTKAEYQAKKFASEVGKMARTVNQIFATLGVGVGVGAFVALIKGSIDAADKLQDLSQSTGVAVETLGGIGFAAKQAGTDLETVVKAFGKFNLEIAKAIDGNKDAAKAFSLLGLSVADLKRLAPDEALAKVADKFAAFQDGPNKAAIANELFKKGFQALIPLLNEGGDALRKNIEYYKRYSGVTEQLTKDADKFNDTLEKAKLLSGAFANTLTAALLPSLQSLVEQFVAMKEKGDGFKGAAQDIADILKGIAVGAIAAASGFTATGRALGAFAAATKATFSGEGALASKILEEAAGDANKQLERTLSLIDAINNPKPGAVGVTKPKGVETPSLGKDAGDAARKILEGQLKAQENIIKDEQEILRDREQFLQAYYRDDLLSIAEFYDGQQAARDEALRNTLAAFDKEIAALQAFANNPAIKAQDRIHAQSEIADAVSKRGRAEQDANVKAQQSYLDLRRSIQQYTDSILETQAAVLNMIGNERAAMEIRLEIQNRSLKTRAATEGNTGTLANIAALEKQALAQADLNSAARAYQNTLEALSIEQANIALAEASGNISSLEAITRRAQAVDSYIEKLREQVAIQERIAETLVGPAHDEAILKIQQMKLAIDVLAESAKELEKTFRDIGVNALTDGLVDVATGAKTASEAIRSMEHQIVSSISRIAAQRIAQSVFGTGTGGGDVVSWFAKLFAGSAGGGGAGWTSGFDLPGFATGTPFAPGGMAIVGERGPELVNLPRGAQVTPMNNGGHSMSVHQTINVLPGASTRSATQAAMQAGLAAQRALEKNA